MPTSLPGELAYGNMCFSQSREINAVGPPGAWQRCKKVTIAWSAAIGVPLTNSWFSNLSGRSARGSISSSISSSSSSSSARGLISLCGFWLQDPECKTPHLMAFPQRLQVACKPALSNMEARNIFESTSSPVSGSSFALLLHVPGGRRSLLYRRQCPK